MAESGGVPQFLTAANDDLDDPELTALTDVEKRVLRGTLRHIRTLESRHRGLYRRSAHRLELAWR